MKVILVPARLRLAAASLLLCVPLAAFETVIVTRAPWWRLPRQSILVWSAAVALICVPLAGWIARGRRPALGGLQVFFSLWVLLSAWTAIRTRNPALGFLALFLSALFGAASLWLRREIGRSFYDPGMRWFQGLPRAVPGLACRVIQGEQEVDCRVSRLDREGAFVFSRGSVASPAPPVPLRPDLPSELVFEFRGHAVRCQGIPRRALAGSRGAGFQFDGMAPDSRKQLGDFIEALKGEGYAL